MAKSRKKKPYVQAVIFGMLSIASYIILFSNARQVMEEFTRGGVYTALPVATAFYFSFIHGAFASNVLEVLGIEAKKKK
jgi:F0F1-type ATP synthase assembly protein I